MEKEKSVENQYLQELKAKRDRLDKLIKLIEAGGTGDSSGLTDTIEKATEIDIKFDTFFNLSIVEAAKKYLKMSKSARSTNEIVEALNRGGLKVNYPTVASTLLRNALKKNKGIYNVGRGKWGLSEWYPAGTGNNKRATKAINKESLLKDNEGNEENK